MRVNVFASGISDSQKRVDRVHVMYWTNASERTRVGEPVQILAGSGTKALRCMSNDQMRGRFRVNVRSEDGAHTLE